ncbi:unnamed protein product [Closterium sp. Yama58-4]|nr:unnamed protein product [Closterium sp. Yama58-4]
MADVDYYTRGAPRSMTVHHDTLPAHVRTAACLLLLLLYCSPTTAVAPLSRQLVSKLPAARRGRGISTRTAPPRTAQYLAARREERRLFYDPCGTYPASEARAAVGGTSSASSPASAADTAALKAVYAAALIPIPTDQDACTWYGVSCCTGNTVTILDLSYNYNNSNPVEHPPTPRLCNRTAREPGKKFPATLSDSIGQLTGLTDLRLKGLWLAGSVPISLYRLTKMQNLDLSHNCFAGPLPAAIFRMPALISVIAGQNFFSGGLPQNPAAYAAAELSTMDFGSNRLSGRIPAALATLPSRDMALYLYSNRLTGSIPPALLQRVFALYLSQNRLSGDLSGQKIMSYAFSASGNRLTGNFNSIGFGQSVTGIDVSDNLFSGSFPKIVCHRSNLAFNFSHNRLTGAVPADCFNSASSFPKGLFLSHNNFSGSLQPFSNLPTDITALDLGPNRFTGRIPQRLASLLQLTYLNLGANALTGPIPAFCQGGQALNFLNLASNALSGPPTPLSSPSCAAFLNFLNLASNRLSGSIPATVSSFTNLKRLHLYNNALTRAIPAGVSKMKWLRGLWLSYNNLTGSIPAVWPARIRQVLLVGNQLSGAVPAALSKLKKHTFKPGNDNLCGTPLPACA